MAKKEYDSRLAQIREADSVDWAVLEMTENLLAYITCGSEEEAKKIGRTLVEEKLAACANIFPKITSIYEWEGKVEESGEAVLIAKTTQSNYQELENKVKSLHSYQTPCIINIQINGGNAAFLEWILAQTKKLK